MKEIGDINNQMIDSDMTTAEALRPNTNFEIPNDIYDRQVLINVKYLSFDGLLRQGQIVVDRELEHDVIDLFNLILEIKFPIQSVIPIADIKFNFNDLKNKQTIHNLKENTPNIFNSWIIPGKKNMQICIGGLERDYMSNDVSHNELNHSKMTLYRNECLMNVTNYYSTLEIDGPENGDIILITWGSVYGVVKTVYDELKNYSHISLLCIKYLNPLHVKLEKIIHNFKKIIVIEENLGQLAILLQAKYLIKVIQINQISGKPFKINHLKSKILSIININNE